MGNSTICTRSYSFIRFHKLSWTFIQLLIIHQIFSLARDWSKRVTWVNIPQLKLGIFPNFQNRARCVKDLKDNKDNSLHLGQKYARIFVLGHYLFLVPHSFPRATLSENCSPLGTDNVRGQISEHIFALNGGYCLYIPSYTFINLHTPLYTFIHLHAPSYTFMHFHTPSYTFMHLHARLYTFIHLHALSYTFIHLHAPSSTFIRYTFIHLHTHSSTFIHPHTPLSTSMHLHPPSYTFMHFHTP